MEPERFWNTPDVSDYIKELEDRHLPRGGQEILNQEQLMTEAVFLGLRTAEGIDIGRFERKFDVRFQDLFAKVLEEFQEKKLLEVTAERCTLTRSGLLLLDAIAASFADHVPE